MDVELERLRRRRLLELRRRLFQRRGEGQPEEARKPSNRELLNRYFYGRAWEVYNAARAQFPEVMPQIEEALVAAMRAGKIRERISGESLYHFLRQVGLPVRLRTTIRFKEHGELKTLEQKIRESR
ncbi:MAG: DNA-binding protein [Candidatus Bathyarchaeia archaeon]